MSFLSRLSLANKSIVALATIAILIFGGSILPLLKQELLPALTYPAISIISAYPGASPETVEQSVTTPLEQSIQGTTGLTGLTSYSNTGSSIIVAAYDYGTDLNQAQQTLAQRISSVQADLPVTPQIQTYNVSDQPIINLAITSNATQQDLALALQQKIVPLLKSLSGIANVSLTGVRQQIVSVTLDLNTLQAHGLSVNQVESTLQANNISLPAGEVTHHTQTSSIRVGNTFTSLQDLKDLVVGVQVPSQQTEDMGTPSTISGSSQGANGGSMQLPGSVPIRLSDVANVQEVLAPSSTLTRTNSQPSLGIAVTKTPGGNTVAISQEIRAQISHWEQTLGHQARISIVADQAPYIQRSVESLTHEGLLGAGFAILVILIFLFSLRSTLVTAISIPLSIVLALICLWAGNFSLNILTLGGLTIAVGRVVDDSIVVLENIYRHLHSGDEKRTAVLLGVQEVAGAVTASTITTVAVFVPIAFTGGQVGEFFRPFAFAVTVALLGSLLVALTIIPVLAFWFLYAPNEQERYQWRQHEQTSWLERLYVPLLQQVMRFRILTLLAAVLILVGTVLLYPLLATNLFSSSSQNTFSFSQQLPPGTSLDATNQAAKQIENVLANISAITIYQVTVGNSDTQGSAGSNTATYAVTTSPDANTQEIEQLIRNRLRVLHGIGTVTLLAGQQGTSSALTITIQASEITTLRQASTQVQQAITGTPGISDISSNLNNSAPLIDVRVDPEKALQYGLTAAEVSQSLRMIYTGTTIMQVTLNGGQQDVDIKLGQPATTVSAMQQLLLPGTTAPVHLGDLATIKSITGPTQITHIATNRTATVSALITSDNVGAVSKDIQQRLDRLHLPSGSSVTLGGVTADQNDAFRNLGIALLVAIVLVYIIMVATFRSLILPIILLIAVPFAGTGSILLLLTTHTPLGAPTLIGLLMLVGIVVTNAIVLLDLVHQQRRKGLSPREAVIEGSRRRLRPILMTAIATVLALSPMALGLDGSSGFIAGPLAIAVVGGLTTSTLLTLLLVPTLYVTIEEIRIHLRPPTSSSRASRYAPPQLSPTGMRQYV